MKNLKLKDLKVQSFVTSLEKKQEKTLKGGWPLSVDGCDTEFDVCNTQSWPIAQATGDPGKLIGCYHDL